MTVAQLKFFTNTDVFFIDLISPPMKPGHLSGDLYCPSARRYFLSTPELPSISNLNGSNSTPNQYSKSSQLSVSGLPSIYSAGKYFPVEFFYFCTNFIFTNKDQQG